MSLVIILLLIMFILGSLPLYPYSRDWGYNPFYIVLVIVIIFFLTGYL